LETSKFPEKDCRTDSFPSVFQIPRGLPEKVEIRLYSLPKIVFVCVESPERRETGFAR
jgi:hypothetical protein